MMRMLCARNIVLLVATLSLFCLSITLKFQQNDDRDADIEISESWTESNNERDLAILIRPPYQRSSSQQVTTRTYAQIRTNTAQGVLCRRVACTEADLRNIYGVGPNGPSPTIAPPTPPPVSPTPLPTPMPTSQNSMVIKRPPFNFVSTGTSTPETTPLPTEPPTMEPMIPEAVTTEPTESPTDFPTFIVVIEDEFPEETNPPTLAPTDMPSQEQFIEDDDPPTAAPTFILEIEDVFPEETKSPTLAPTNMPSQEQLIIDDQPTGAPTDTPSQVQFAEDDPPTMAPSQDEFIEDDPPTLAPTDMPSQEQFIQGDSQTQSPTRFIEDDPPTPTPSLEDANTDSPSPAPSSQDVENSAREPTPTPSLQDSMFASSESSGFGDSIVPTPAIDTSMPSLEELPTREPAIEDGGTDPPSLIVVVNAETSGPTTEDSVPTMTPTAEDSVPTLSPTAEDSLQQAPTVAPSSDDGAIARSCEAKECVFTIDVSADAIDSGVIVDMNFMLGDVLSITSIDAELASTYGEDLEIVLTSPSGDQYVLMEDTIAETGEPGSDREDFDLGVEPDDSSLRNVGTYTFVEAGGSGFTSPYSLPDIEYNAEFWGLGGPYSSGEWNLEAIDNAVGDPASIGQVTIRYCGVCVSGDSTISAESQPTAEPVEDDSSLAPAASPTAEPMTLGPTVDEDASFPPTSSPTVEDASFGPAFADTPSPSEEVPRGAEQFSNSASPTQSPRDPSLPPSESGECTEVTLDFDTLSGGSRILGGSYLNNEYRDTYGVVLSASGGYLQFPRVFNTANANEQDAHLGSPNEKCEPAGPGVGFAGEPIFPGSNCESLGNVLIIQDPGDTGRPKDNEGGGVISFEIDSSRVESVKEIGLLSINNSDTTVKVSHFTSSGRKAPKMIEVDAMGANSFQTISIDREKVFQVDVNMGGQGAVAFITLCVNL